MKIALCSSFVPFIHGGYRNIVDWLALMLEVEGHQVERIYLPQIDEPLLLFQQKIAYRWVNLESADRIICFRPPSYLIPHPYKILWFIHHFRLFYDLWNSDYRNFPNDSRHRGIKEALYKVDNAAFSEAKKIFTNSKVVSKRLKKFNQIDSEVLYPPINNPERFYCKEYNNEILCICRMEHHKRQHLLIEAMRYVKTPVSLRLCGISSNSSYFAELNVLIKTYKLQKKVTIEERWISEEEKINLLSECLATAYLPFEEDSYGYPSLEASHASKGVLTTFDSGGVTELIIDGVNGYITEPSAQAIAEAMDKFYLDRKKSRDMGKNALARITELDISWTYVLQRLLS